MEITAKIFEIMIASVVANLIATRIVVAEGWQGAINSALAGSLIYLLAWWVGKFDGNLGDGRRKILRFVSETLVLVAWSVILVGSLFSWALANQPDNNLTEIKQSEVVVGKQEVPQQVLEINRDKIW